MSRSLIQNPESEDEQMKREGGRGVGWEGIPATLWLHVETLYYSLHR